VVSNIITFIVDTRVYTLQGVTVCNVFVQVKTNKRSSTQPRREQLADYTLRVKEDKTKTVSSIDERLTSPDNQDFPKLINYAWTVYSTICATLTWESPNVLGIDRVNQQTLCVRGSRHPQLIPRNGTNVQFRDIRSTAHFLWKFSLTLLAYRLVVGV